MYTLTYKDNKYMNKYAYEESIRLVLTKTAKIPEYYPPDDDNSWYVPYDKLNRANLGKDADLYFPSKYTFREGDDPWRVAKKLGVPQGSMMDIKRHNSKYYYPGDIVWVPPRRRLMTTEGYLAKKNRRNWQLGLANRGYDDSLLDAIRYVESKGNNWAVGDAGKAVGPYQQWKSHVDEANRIMGLYKNKYKINVPTFTYDDRTNEDKSRQMTRIILNYYGDKYAFQNKGKQMSLEQFARTHNGGPDGYKQDSTLEYWQNVLNYINANKRNRVQK